MELREYWVVLRRSWWLVLLAGLVAALGAYAYSKFEDRVYRSTARIYVMPLRPDYGGVMFVQNVVRQYSQIILSDRFLATVSEQLQLDLPVGELRTMIITSGTSDDLVIQADVDDVDPGRARAIAGQIAKTFIQDQEARMKDVSKDNRIEVRTYDEPTVPVLMRPKTRVNVAAGAIFGLLVGVVTAFALAYLDDTIKSGEDVERYVELPVMGSIPTIST